MTDTPTKKENQSKIDKAPESKVSAKKQNNRNNERKKKAGEENLGI